jgi:hypothetical protein
MEPYIKIGHPICDAIIVPYCVSVFGETNHHVQMKAHFQYHRVPVAVVVDAKKEGFVFVGLDDAKN